VLLFPLSRGLLFKTKTNLLIIYSEFFTINEMIAAGS
jgi:hypothetical protein